MLHLAALEINLELNYSRSQEEFYEKKNLELFNRFSEKAWNIYVKKSHLFQFITIKHMYLGAIL